MVRGVSQLELLLAASNVKLPLNLSPDDFGVVLDADGREVFTVDVNHERPDEQADAIALLIARRVNSSCGFWTVEPPRESANHG